MIWMLLLAVWVVTVELRLNTLSNLLLRKP